MGTVHSKGDINETQATVKQKRHLPELNGILDQQVSIGGDKSAHTTSSSSIEQLSNPIQTPQEEDSKCSVEKSSNSSKSKANIANNYIEIAYNHQDQQHQQQQHRLYEKKKSHTSLSSTFSDNEETDMCPEVLPTVDGKKSHRWLSRGVLPKLSW